MNDKDNPLQNNIQYHITDQFIVGNDGFFIARCTAKQQAQFMVGQYHKENPSAFFHKSFTDMQESAIQDYSDRIEKAVIAQFQQTGEKPLLPPRCMAIEPSTGQLINLRRGVHGYWGSDWSRSDDPEYNRRSADLINERLGVTKAQETAMLCGSMFNWESELADPRNYDEHGNLTKETVQKKEKKSEHER